MSSCSSMLWTLHVYIFSSCSSSSSGFFIFTAGQTLLPYVRAHPWMLSDANLFVRLTFPQFLFFTAWPTLLIACRRHMGFFSSRVNYALKGNFLLLLFRLCYFSNLFNIRSQIFVPTMNYVCGSS